jgi:SAM-dependent methyltransferase
MDIQYAVCPAEATGLPSKAFDAITSIQSFIYFDAEKAASEIKRLLKADGKIAVVWVAWLPFESKIAEATENLVLQYNPQWTGGGFKRLLHNFCNFAPETFETETAINYTEPIVFTYETWAGRIRACRGVSATLPETAVQEFNREHVALLKRLTEEPFEIPHEISMSVLTIRD